MKRQKTIQGISDNNAKTIPTIPNDEGTDISTAEINPKIPIFLGASFESRKAMP